MNILSDLTVEQTIDALLGYRVGGAAASGSYLRGDGVRFVSSALLASDLSGNVSSGNIAGAYTGITGVGTITTGVWNGTAIAYSALSGVPSTFTPASHVHDGSEITTGTIPGTVTWGGVAIAYGALSGVPSTFAPSSHTHPVSEVTGTLLETQGGTGENTYAVGDILVGNGVNSLTKLAANGSATNKFLLSVSSGEPYWQQVAWADILKTTSSLADLTTRSAADLSSGNLPSARVAGAYAGITGVGTITTGVWDATALIWAKVSKTGSSLADLATRSASDLDSGTLPALRLVGSYTGITAVGTLDSLWAEGLIGNLVSSTASYAFQTIVGADAHPRFRLLGSGNLTFGSGSSAPDTTLARSSAEVMTIGGNYIPTAASSTKTTAGAPYTNDGYVTLSINGTSVRVMTTA